MMQLAIIDDEAKTRSFLNAIISDMNPEISIVGEAHSVRSAHRLINETQPQVILLDVELGDGTAFDLLARLDEERPHVIFVTAYDHYAVQALRADAVDYLEKPINPDELKGSLLKVAQRIREQEVPAYDHLLATLRSGFREKIAIPTRSGLMYLSATEILCIKASGAYSEITLEHDQKPILISRTLKDIQPALQQLGFVRLHRSYLINASKIKELNKTDGGHIVLNNGLQIPFSKQYREQAIEVIKSMTTLL
ncbi:MAG: LytTR family DNA-binding domain-containing protein [Bacteroidota bacterium]